MDADLAGIPRPGCSRPAGEWVRIGGLAGAGTRVRLRVRPRARARSRAPRWRSLRQAAAPGLLPQQPRRVRPSARSALLSSVPGPGLPGAQTVLPAWCSRLDGGALRSRRCVPRWLHSRSDGCVGRQRAGAPDGLELGTSGGGGLRYVWAAGRRGGGAAVRGGVELRQEPAGLPGCGVRGPGWTWDRRRRRPGRRAASSSLV